MTFGRLKVIRRYEHDYITPSTGKHQSKWVCECSCGNTKIVAHSQLTSGHTRSCGCYQRERSREAHTTHGGRFDRLHGVWANMKNRCYNPNYLEYYSYGGIGITVCDEWQEYQPFKEWAMSHGYDDSVKRGQKTLDRINVNMGYTPDNCRFVDMFVQANNKHNNIKYKYNGKEYSLRELSKISGKSYDYLYYRIRTKGMKVEEVI